MLRVRILGVALVAVFALSVVAASSASAFTLFLSHPANQMVTAGQKGKHKFTVGGASVECNKATFLGNAPGLEFTLFKTTAAYSECTAFGFVGSSVRMNGCEYQLHIGGVVDVENCETGKEIEIEVNNGGPCILKMPAQSGLKSVTYANVTGANGRASVEIKIAVKSITGTSNGQGTGCPAAGAVTGEYTGSSVAEGAEGGVLVD
jgi:hypothetical protein